MKLIIKEYLSLLKESKELDKLIPELLLSMEHKTISKAQVGTRQYGVDVASVGIDIDGIEKVFLFTIKEGNLSRNDWDGGSPQNVRPSLDEIQDVYITTHLENKYSSLPKKIIVVTGGDLMQNIQQNWSAYTKRYTIENELEFEFWGGDELSLLIEKYLFNEYLIPEKLRSKFRKTLALLNETDYDLRDYCTFLTDLLEHQSLEKKSRKEQKKVFRLIYLSLNIIHSWAESENNLKHALIASERVILNTWGFLVKHDLVKTKSLTDIIGKLFYKNLEIISKYCERLKPAMKIENGISMYGNDFTQESIIVFEQLGILALLGNLFHFTGILNKNEEYLKYSYAIKDLLKEYIDNHKSLYNPVYDSHIIDISLVFILLKEWNEIEFLNNWMDDLIKHIEFAYTSYGRYFPIDSDKFDDLVDINIREGYKKEDYIKTSTLIPILAQWCVKLGLIENYKSLKYVSNNAYKESTLQIWYPDEEIEKYMYTTNAGFKCGYAEAPIKFPENIKDFAEQMNEIHNSDNFIDIEKLSCTNHGLIPLVLISSRHFRMPIFPHFWNLQKNESQKK